MTDEQEKQEPKSYKVFLGVPNAGRIWPACFYSGMTASKHRHEIVFDAPQFGDVQHNFNQLWCLGLNARANNGVNRWAMLHSDIGAEPGWLDILLEEMDRTGADVMTTCIAIKDDRGLSTTGIRYAGVRGARRFTFRELARLPETFSIADTDEPNEALAINTGLWICRFDPESSWIEKFPGFIKRHGIDYVGEPSCHFDSEDWIFSEWAAQQGLKVYATRKVKAHHVGEVPFPNNGIWGGWETELQRPDRPLTISLPDPKITVETEHPIAVDSFDHKHPLGTRIDNTTSWAWLRKLFELIPADQVRLLDLGCSGGGLVRSVLEAGGFAIGLEGSDYSQKRRRAEWGRIPDYLHLCDLTKPFKINNCSDSPVKFNVVTAWELFEHIAEADLEAVLANLANLVTDDAILFGSISQNVEPHHMTARAKDWWLYALRDVRGSLELEHAPDLEDHFGPDLVRGSYDGSFHSFSIGFRWRKASALVATGSE